MRTFRKFAVFAALVCLLPFASVALASLIAYVASCDLDIGMSGACVVAGMDIGGALRVLGAFGYGTFFTVPALILLVVVWALAEIVHRLRSPAHG